MKKKVLFIVLPIVLAIIIVGGVIAAILINNNKSIGSVWGDTYYAYLTEAIKEKDLNDAEEKYGIKLDMKDAKIQFCEVDEDSSPSMVMTYTKNDNSYVNVYQINDDKKVTYIAYKQPSEVQFLYNIEKEDYGWYIHEMSSSSDSYSSLKNITDRLKSNAKKAEESDNVNLSELEADYTINKEEAQITQETTDGDTLTMNRFDQLFVVPDVKLNEQIDFNVDIKEKDLKKSMTNAVDNYKKLSKIVTDDVKEDVSKKAEESKNKTNEIETAKKKVNQQKEMKVTQSDLSSKLGEHLKYFSACYLGGTYGPYQIFKLEDQSGKVSIPGVDKYMVVEEVVGLNSIEELNNSLKKYMADDVISKLNNTKGPVSKYMKEYNGKVYIVRGGIGDGDTIYCDKAKLISSEGDTTIVELEDYFLLGDFVSAKITVTLKYDEETSSFKITDYSVKELDQQSSYNEPVTTTQNQSTNSTSSASKLTPYEYDTSVNKKVTEGDYTRLNSGPHTGKLTIKNATSNSFDFDFDCIYMTSSGYPNLGNLSGTAKAIKGGNFVFSEHTDGKYGYDYNVFFNISGEGDNMRITVKDECCKLDGSWTIRPYAGMNVTFEGEYAK